MEDSQVCFSFIINFRDNKDPEAWDRVLDAFLLAVKRENAGAGGGMHPLGSNNYCEDCRDAREDSEMFG